MNKFRAQLCLTLVVCTAVLAACGGSDKSAAGPSGGTATSVKVGVLSIADVAPLYLGMKQGFFQAEGLNVEPVAAQGGAAIVPLLVSGEVQFGFGNAISLIIGAAKGLPVRIVAQGDQAGNSSGLYVASGSPITSPKDLEGKKIAVVTLKNNATLAVSSEMEKAGADWRKAQFVELSFAQMAQAVKSGNVDAAVTIEPFTTLLAQAGLKKISSPLEDLGAKSTVAPYFTTADYAAKNSDTVARFRRAINKSNEYAQAHTPEVRAIVPTYTDIPPAVSQAMGLPYWSADLNSASIQLQAELAKKYGYIDKLPDIKQLILPGGQ